MFIYWGKKVVYRKLGYVADFCPLCRTPRQFLITRVGLAGHVYGITSGDGELRGYHRTCQECGTALQVSDPSSAYASISQTLAPIAELTQRTFPNLTSVRRDRLALEEQVRSAPSQLSGDARRALIKEPFLLLTPKVESRFAATHIDKETGLSIIGSVLILFAGATIIGRFAPDYAQIDLVFLGLGVALIVWQGSQSRRRFMRRQVIPTLARALRPLRPTDGELAAVKADLLQVRNRVGSAINLADLRSAIAPTFGNV